MKTKLTLKKTKNYLENTSLKVITVGGYGYNENMTDSYGTRGGATYYITPNNYIYRITPKQYDAWTKEGCVGRLHAELFDYNGEVTSDIIKYLCKNSNYWNFKNGNNFIRTFNSPIKTKGLWIFDK